MAVPACWIICVWRAPKSLRRSPYRGLGFLLLLYLNVRKVVHGVGELINRSTKSSALSIYVGDCRINRADRRCTFSHRGVVVDEMSAAAEFTGCDLHWPVGYIAKVNGDGLAPLAPTWNLRLNLCR